MAPPVLAPAPTDPHPTTPGLASAAPAALDLGVGPVDLVPYGKAGLGAAQALAARWAGPDGTWAHANTGFAGQRCAIAHGPARSLFIKWAHLPEGRAALLQEAANLRALAPHTPTGSPRLVAFDGALATDAVAAGTQHWTRRTIEFAADTLLELAAAPLELDYHPTNVLPGVGGDYERGLGAGLNRRAVADQRLLTRALDLADPARLPRLFGPDGQVVCHADTHTQNWVLDRTGRPALVDYGHLCRGPAGWDLGILVVCLGTATRDRDVTATWAAQRLDASAHRDMAARAVAAWWLRFLHLSCRSDKPVGRYALAALPFATRLLVRLGV